MFYVFYEFCLIFSTLSLGRQNPSPSCKRDCTLYGMKTYYLLKFTNHLLIKSEMKFISDALNSISRISEYLVVIGL